MADDAPHEPLQINVAVWHDDLRGIFETEELGAGALALVEIVALQLDQARGFVEGLSGDVLLERGLGEWQQDYDAAAARIGWIATKFKRISEGPETPEVKLAAVWNFVARPILDGVYPTAMMADLPAFAKRGITAQGDGSGRGMGEAYGSATLWNQAVTASDLDHHYSDDFLTNAYRKMLSNVVVELQRSAPTEQPTWADKTVVAVEAVADAPRALLEAIGVTSLLVWGGVAVGAAVILYIVLNAKRRGSR